MGDPDLRTCLIAAEKAYDAELNREFKEALDVMDPVSATQLKDSQRKWLAAREADRKVWIAPWRAGAGTMATVAEYEVEAGRTRQRVIELGLLIQSVKG